MFQDAYQNLLLDPVTSLGILGFYVLLISFPLALISLFNKSLSWLVSSTTILVNILLALQLVCRWIISSHFPISNLFESLCFLSWGLTLVQLLLQKEYQTSVIPCIGIPASLLTLGFACFVLPDNLRIASNLVPALRSSWLVMHVSVVMLSYSALIFGSLLSTSVLIVDNKKPLQIRSSSIGIGGYKNFNLTNHNHFQHETDFSPSEKLDTLSYRSILIGFFLLTLGLITGAIWANEAWGTWGSWDPKETWAFISWIFYACYLHMRISKGWQGRKPAILATTGFFIVLICYLGVNYLGVGLHSYGWFLG